MKDNLLLIDLESKIDNLLNFNPLEENVKPIIKLANKDKFYDIYIYLRGLTKEEILIKYVNNFLILNLSLKNKNNKVNLKRVFYLKNVDIDKIKNIVCANLIYFKIPKI
jgi:HSP20 family molecular chaperone IbpA